MEAPGWQTGPRPGLAPRGPARRADRGRPVAARAARTMASATASAASAPIRTMSAGRCVGAGGEREDDIAVVHRVNGTIARASPSCAICAILVACVLVSVALVATTASVVFSPTRGVDADSGADRASAHRRTAGRRGCASPPRPCPWPDR